MAQMPKTDPACVTLASQIDALNQEGVGEKVSKAAAKKYKIKSGRPCQGRRAQQGACGIPDEVLKLPAEPGRRRGGAGRDGGQGAKKSKPPVPSPKPVASVMAPQSPPTVRATPEGLGSSPPPNPNRRTSDGHWADDVC